MPASTSMPRFSLQIWAVLIAVLLWFQVHGDGVGTLTIEAPVQVQGLSRDLLIVNDIPERVRVTVSGLRNRLNRLSKQDIQLVVNASAVSKPMAMDYALSAKDILYPVGIQVERIQPDRLPLQIDRLVQRDVAVQAQFSLPSDWEMVDVQISPATLSFSGPEVWLESLTSIHTIMVRPDLKAGAFSVTVGVESPAGKAIRLLEPSVQVTVQGVLQPKLQSRSGAMAKD